MLKSKEKKNWKIRNFSFILPLHSYFLKYLEILGVSTYKISYLEIFQHEKFIRQGLVSGKIRIFELYS